MSFRTRSYIFLLAAGAALAAAPASAQSWSAGAAWGVAENVSHSFELDQLKPHDLSGWVQYESQPEVQVRLTYGSLKTAAANSGRTVSDGSSEVEVPHLTSHIDYLTLGVSYEFVTYGDFASGIFGGIGGYKIKPDTAPPGFEFASDPSRTVFGWHFGADGAARLVSRLSLVGRLELHWFTADQHHTILTAGAGLQWKF